MGRINTILIDENNSSLLVADEDGRVYQLSFDFQGNLGKMLKDYGQFRMGGIYTSYLFGNIAVFGGWNGKLDFINTGKRQSLGDSFDLAPKAIHSIEFCWVQKKSQTKALLTVSGEYYDYYRKSDLLDVTHFISKKIKNKKNQNTGKSKKEISQNDKILENKFAIKSIQLSSKKLKKIKKDLL